MQKKQKTKQLKTYFLELGLLVLLKNMSIDDVMLYVYIV